MRHRYFYLDPDYLQALLASLDLMRVFNQLLLASGGDVEQTMEWMRYLQRQGYVDERVDLEEFFASLEDQQMVGRDSDGSLHLTSSRRTADSTERLRGGVLQSEAWRPRLSSGALFR